MLALQNGGPTIYFRNRMSDAERTLASKGLHLDRTALALLASNYGLDSRLQGIWVDVSALCHLFNNDLRPGSVDLVTYQEILLSICYRLLRFRTLIESRTKFDEHSTLHLGLLLFIMTLFLHHGSRKVVSFELVSQILLGIATESATVGPSDHMVLWLMIIGGIWTSSDACSSWLVPRIKETADRIGIQCWKDARIAIQELPWIKVVHDKPGETLWNRLGF